MADLLYNTSLAILPTLYVWISKLWFSTCRLTIRDEKNIYDAQKQGNVIVPFWHYSLFYMLYHVSRYPAVALVSASKDGEYIARVAQKLGFEAVRGSSNRHGAKALKQLLRAMRAGKHVGIVADGSQGPVRRVQPGTVYLASKTGSVILPMVWSADRCKIFKSWDRTVLPMPFSKIVMRYGEPIKIPSGLNSEGIEQYRLVLEKKMNNLYNQVWAEFEIDRHDDGPGEQIINNEEKQ